MGYGRYYFHILDDGFAVPDEEGMTLSRHAARAELRASVGDLTAARLRAGRGAGDGRVELADDEGHILETLPFRKILN